MCTLTWLSRPDGYTLYFNRDEQRTRARAQPPFAAHLDGVAFIAGRDPDGGGTWLAANERGLSLALLNLYEVPAARAGDRSRGLLVLESAGAESLDALESRVRVAPLALHRAFELAAFAPGEPVRVFRWDGRALRVDEIRDQAGLLASSSAAPTRARASRRARHAELRAAHADASDGWLARLHADHAPVPGALSTCVHRDDAVTVSLSRVRVDRARVEVAYSPGSPCRTELGEPVVIARG